MKSKVDANQQAAFGAFGAKKFVGFCAYLRVSAVKMEKKVAKKRILFRPSFKFWSADIHSDAAGIDGNGPRSSESPAWGGGFAARSLTDSDLFAGLVRKEA